MDTFYTVQEVADRLSVTAYVVRRWIKRGDLPAYRVGGQQRGKLLVSKAALQAYIEDRVTQQRSA